MYIFLVWRLCEKVTAQGYSFQSKSHFYHPIAPGCVRVTCVDAQNWTLNTVEKKKCGVMQCQQIQNTTSIGTLLLDNYQSIPVIELLMCCCLGCKIFKLSPNGPRTLYPLWKHLKHVLFNIVMLMGKEAYWCFPVILGCHLTLFILISYIKATTLRWGIIILASSAKKKYCKYRRFCKFFMQTTEQWDVE